MNTLNRFRKWLAASRRNQLLAAGAALVGVGTLAAVGAVIAASGGGDGDDQVAALTASPSPSATEAPTRTPRRTAAAAPTPTPVTKPDPQTLLQPGYVLDRALDVNLDGSETGQIVVVSHTSHQVLLCTGRALNEKTGEPLPTPQSGCEDVGAVVPAREDCSQDPNLDPNACWFQAEVFAYDVSSGWISRLVSKNHRGGVQDVGEAETFRLDGEREAVVLAFHYCTGIGSGCGWWHEVLTMIGGEVKLAGGGWQAIVTIEESSVTISNPAYFGDDPFCCPSARRSETLALDPATNELGVIASELVACKEGELVGVPEPPQRNTIELRGCGSFEITAATVVEPPSIGGVQGLHTGDMVRLEYEVGECPEDGISYNCSWGKVLAATRITVLNR